MAVPEYWQAWAYLFVAVAASVAIVVYLQRNDPELLRRRTRNPAMEQEVSQRFLQLFAMLIFFGTFVLCALDHNASWSRVPLLVEIAGFLIVVLGFLVYFVVFRENTFAGLTIEVTSDQKVISTGPYARGRHPMYVGLLLVLLGTPLALGSWWGLLTFVPMLLVIALRIRHEEAFLTERLPGYAEYCSKLRYRLIPSIW